MLGPKLLRGMSSQTTIPATEDQLAAAKASLDGWMCVLRSMRTILKFYMLIVNSFFSGSEVSDCSTSTSTGWIIASARNSLALNI